jgi:hypothetical protein
MASVRLDFTPPTIPDITKLHIEEAPAMEGPFTQIEVTTEVGTYPGYISYYTTQTATSTNDWFRIRWETSAGVMTAYSGALQGGTKTLVQEIVDRVLLRNPSLNENVVTQEAQAVVSQVFPQEDPNTLLASDATYVQIRGMTNMTLARSLIATSLASGGTASGFTAGLVSIKSGSTAADPTKAIDALIKAANDDLGLNYSVVLLMAEVEGVQQAQLHGIDLSRTIAMVDYS